MTDNYLKSVFQQLEYYKSVGDKTFTQITTDNLFWAPNEASNSIAIIVNHLHGNMLSRWTHFLSTDGEKDWRNRDSEFEDVIKTEEEFYNKWNAGWQCVFDELATINQTNFDTTIYIRNQSHTIIEAINRQLAHYAYHIGQIVYLSKLIKNESWTSLTIPKGESNTFNKAKFAKGKHDGHFSDDLKK